jgi:hypothetical protein
MRANTKKKHGMGKRFAIVMKRRIRIAGASLMAAAGLIGALAGPASAATPANQACVGESLSVLAKPPQPSPGSFGAAVVGFAQAPNGRPGLGDTAQAGAAGQIPDEVLPNTCND